MRPREVEELGPIAYFRQRGLAAGVGLGYDIGVSCFDVSSEVHIIFCALANQLRRVSKRKAASSAAVELISIMTGNSSFENLRASDWTRSSTER